jgi:hypothetical protein
MAFDVVDHQLLLLRLRAAGVVDEALSWFESYLSDRFYKISCNQALSAPEIMTCGVPQGSVLGPVLFSLFINSISEGIKNHQIHHVMYADDLQIFIRSAPEKIDNTIEIMESCLVDVKQWLETSGLVLNDNKTECIIFSSKHRAPSMIGKPLKIGSSTVASKASLRDLGFILDNKLVFNEHVKKVTKSAFCHLRIISKIRRYLSVLHSKLLVNALGLSRIDFCVGFFYGVEKHCQEKLQKIIRYSMRLVKKLNKREDVTHHLKDDNWLSVSQRAQLRLLTIMFKVTHYGRPKQLTGLVHSQSRVERTLRSNSMGLFHVQRTISHAGDRAFEAASPRLFNALPLTLRNLTSLEAFINKTTAYLNDV